ncbi:uncharacterized protein DUF5082 [Scopulibacillus darangshiensis]|uniref:Uncharacterized protein DUF5082 n=1 Tax=Scopulibacillus darangshiensis TaxID=442528 RepID=A0A4R2PAS1_9BACL|nr:DUF5082 family protein [Scopulibacillus darangshiensis]TCP31201.1 uncharacterized protein DUF5082 [Scopulibacillus darangshiensis]
MLPDNEVMIRMLNNDIASLQSTLHDNQEKIARLHKAKRHITGGQDDLSEYKNLIKNPDLTSESWAGKHAAEFLDIRETIDNAYNDIVTIQVESILQGIEDKISQLENANLDLSDDISSKRNRINHMHGA